MQEAEYKRSRTMYLNHSKSHLLCRTASGCRDEATKHSTNRRRIFSLAGTPASIVRSKS